MNRMPFMHTLKRFKEMLTHSTIALLTALCAMQIK